MSMKDEVKLIAKGVGKGLSSIIFPQPAKGEKPSEYMTMHWCEKCGAYHKAKG